MHMWSGTSTRAKNNNQVVQMVDGAFSSAVAGQPQSLNLVHGWDRIKHVHVYSLLGLSTVKRYPTMTKQPLRLRLRRHLEVKPATASRQAAAGSRNFAWSTGKPMGRPCEPMARSP